MLHAARWVLFAGGGVAAALLLPSTAVPESRVATGSAGAALTATARLNFRIIIPRVLYVQVGSVSDPGPGPDKVSVMTNSHNASLNATLRTPDSKTPERGSLILSGAARKAIAQDATCSLASTPAGRAGEARQIVCTVSMP
jgi:hypothetical protein